MLVQSYLYAAVIQTSVIYQKFKVHIANKKSYWNIIYQNNLTQNIITLWFYIFGYFSITIIVTSGVCVQFDSIICC